jgi:tetratricopeptide (TPR) repeat protein
MKIFNSYALRILLFFLVVSTSILAQSVEELFKEGDQYAEEKWDNQKALDTYLQADKISPNDYEVYWRISRAYVDLAEHMPANTDEQKDAQLAKYQVAFDWADKAVKLAPDKSVTYLRRAIANGRIALFKGVFSVIGIVNSVKADLEKAIKLGNGGNVIQSVAHYVLGRTHAKVCEKAYLIRLPLGLGWGDTDKAEMEYKKAIELRPNFRMFYLDLAKLYIDDDEYQKAKEYLTKLENSPKQDEDDDKYLSEAKNLMEKIKNE